VSSFPTSSSRKGKRAHFPLLLTPAGPDCLCMAREEKGEGFRRFIINRGRGGGAKGKKEKRKHSFPWAGGLSPISREKGNLLPQRKVFRPRVLERKKREKKRVGNSANNAPLVRGKVIVRTRNKRREKRTLLTFKRLTKRQPSCAEGRKGGKSALFSFRCTDTN